MIEYYLVFLVLSVLALGDRDFRVKKNLGIGLVTFGLFLIIFTGLRHHVGGDWNNYLRMFHTTVPYLSYDLAFNHDDPGFWLLSYWMYDIGWGLYGTNFIASVIFITGLFSLLKETPSPWLGLTVAFPYLIIVVSMGYTRQAIAIGFIMWGITYLRKGKFYRFILAVFFAVTFHKTAILMIGIAVFNKGKGKFFKFLAIGIIAIGMWNAFLAEAQADLMVNYVDAKMQSSGAMIRVIMNVIPALLLILLRKRWKKEFNDYSFWFIIALGSIASLFLVQFASTAVDRIALYFIPIQVIVFSRIVLLLKNKIQASIIKLLVVGYYFAVLNAWLLFGAFSGWWLPYRSVIFLG